MSVREKVIFCLLAFVIMVSTVTLVHNIQSALEKANLAYQEKVKKEEAIEERRHQDMVKAIRDSGK